MFLLLSSCSFLPFVQREAVHKKQMPFLAGSPRLAVRAVKGAEFAFTGAQRKPLTEEADGLGADFGRKGKEGTVAEDGRDAGIATQSLSAFCDRPGECIN